MVLRLIHPDEVEASLEERFEAQSWLYRLTEAVTRATDLDEILEHALDCLQQVLRVERAAILLYDHDRIMRFRSWRNLSDGYRRAVDGHSPWQPDDPDPQPVLIEDVAADPELTGLLPVIRGEGIAALAFVPLIYGGRLLGKFMVYHPAPHRFAPLEVEIAQAVAGHVALAVGRHLDAAELRRTRDQLEIVLESIGDGVTMQGHDGQLLFGNRAALTSLGLTRPEELQALTPAELTQLFEIYDEHGDRMALEDLPGRHALAGQVGVEQLVRYRRRDTGEERWSFVRANPVFDADGQVRFAVNLFRDVTDQRRSEESSRLVAEVATRLAGTLEPEECCTRLAATLVPRLGDACVVHSVDASGAVTHAAAVPDDAGPALDLAAVEQVVAGAELVASDRALHLPLCGRERVIGAMSVWRNTRSPFDAADAVLATKVARYGALALEAALLYRQATEAISLRDDFLSVAGHELRTPLTTAHILVQSLGRGERLPASVDNRLRLLEQTLVRLARLVDDLLDVTRIRAGRLAIDRSPVDLGALVHEVAWRSRDRAARADCELVLDISGPVAGRWDAERLDQVIENLLSNAIKYAPGAPVDLAVEARGDDAVLRVRDRGPGIPDEDRGRVFGRFVRSTASRQQFKGLGLGLWIVRQIVEAHGGSVEVLDVDGPGCCIEVSLPR